MLLCIEIGNFRISRIDYDFENWFPKFNLYESKVCDGFSRVVDARYRKYHQIWQNIKKLLLFLWKNLISLPKPDPPQILIGEASDEFVHRTWIFMLLASSRGNPIKIINEIWVEIWLRLTIFITISTKYSLVQ